MSVASDTVSAIKNVLLMQTNLERLERVVERQGDDIASLREAMVLMNNRLIRIETMVEMAGRSVQPLRVDEQ